MSRNLIKNTKIILIILALSSFVFTKQILAKDKKEKSLNDDIFTEITAMEKRMNDAFLENQKQLKEIFEKANKSDNANKTELTSKEDDKDYYYELNFSGFKKEDVVVEIKNNVLTFSAENTKTKNNSTTNFYYSFLLPQDSIKNNPEIIREEGKIIAKIHKKK